MVIRSTDKRLSCVRARRVPRSSPFSATAADQPTVRLIRELEQLERTIQAAERAAISGRTATQPVCDASSASDITSRRAELERRELALNELRKSLDQERELLDQARSKLTRAKESLKRSIRRFRAHSTEQATLLAERAERLETARLELVQNRREFAREQMRHKGSVRASL